MFAIGTTPGAVKNDVAPVVEIRPIDFWWSTNQIAPSGPAVIPDTLERVGIVGVAFDEHRHCASSGHAAEAAVRGGEPERTVGSGGEGARRLEVRERKRERRERTDRA